MRVAVGIEGMTYGFLGAVIMPEKRGENGGAAAELQAEACHEGHGIRYLSEHACGGAERVHDARVFAHRLSPFECSLRGRLSEILSEKKAIKKKVLFLSRAVTRLGGRGW